MNTEPNRPTVYLIFKPTRNRSGIEPDLSYLDVYGNVRTLLSIEDYPSYKPQEALRKVYDGLKDFNPEVDFIVWAGGEPLAAFLVGSVIADYGIERIKWLRYNKGGTHQQFAQGSTYQVVDVTVTEEDQDDD